LFLKEGSSGLDALGTTQSLSQNTSHGPSVGTQSTLSLYLGPSTISAAGRKTTMSLQKVKISTVVCLLRVTQNWCSVDK